mmetsp:Transcript_22541/g.46821  ORF Transcript_22541/g.46821 Transcript_22541/m.46821 type:complete len:4475 (+) Transcript_22541:277-13701(+)
MASSIITAGPSSGRSQILALYLGLIVLLLHPLASVAAPSDSACATGNHGSESYTFGNGVSCLNGDVFLKSTIVEVGIHGTGSYGTVRKAPSGYQSRNFDHPYTNSLDGNAGFIADYGRDGWGAGSPPFSGDYFIPGYPAEGWVMEWSEGSNNFNTINKGLVQASGMMPATNIEVTSHEQKQSSFWVGKTSNLRVSKVTQFSDNESRGSDELHFSTSVTLKNEGSSAISNIYYMRTVDPDQEQPFTQQYGTKNWVDSQRYVEGETPAARAEGPNGGECTAEEASRGLCTDKCFVAAVGQTHESNYCGLGSINSHCRVNHWGFNNNDASDSWAQTSWTGNSASNPRVADEAIQLHFFYDTIQPGATVQFNYAYVLGAAALDGAMQALDYVSITSPTDVVSGVYALFQAELAQAALTDGGGSARTPSQVDFYIYATLDSASSSAWHSIETLTGRADGSDFTSTDRTFSTTKLVPNNYKEGIGQLKVVVTLSDGTKYDQQMVVELTEGVAMCWDLNLDGVGTAWSAVEPTLPKQLVKGETNGINIVPCNPSDASIISSVSFFMVTKSEYSGETTEQLLVQDFSSPYSINPLIVDSYQYNMDVVISAKVTQTDGKVVGYALPAFVYEPNVAPQSLNFVQQQEVNENTLAGTDDSTWISFGTLAAIDQNEWNTHTYTLNSGTVGSSGLPLSNYFRITNSNLEYKATLNFEEMFGANDAEFNTVSLSILVDDQQAENCCNTFTEVIRVNNKNEAPTGVDQNTFTVNENTNVNTVLHSFAVTDPDANQAHSCSVSGADGYFDIEAPCRLKLVAALDYENRQVHNFNLVVSDNGWGRTSNQQSVFAITVTVGNVNESPDAVEMFRPSSVSGYSCSTPGVTCTVPERAVDSTGAVTGTADGTVIAHLRVKDPECANYPDDYKTPTDCAGSIDYLGSVNTVSLSLITGTDYFELIDTDSIPKLMTKSGGTPLDYEAIPSSGLNFIVRATDNVGNVYDQTLTIIVTDIDEPPQAYPVTCTFEENLPDNRIAGLVSAGSRAGEICMIQADAAGDEELEFSIVGSSSLFTVQSCSGIVFIKTGSGGFDYEAWVAAGSNPYTFQVQVTGSASADPITVTLYLSDVNEAPVFNDASVSANELLGYDDLNDDSFTPGYSVTALTATDPEGHAKTFSIIAGNDGNIFQVVNDGTGPDGSTGQRLTLTSPFNSEVQSTYVLTMQVVDVPGAGLDPKTDTATLTITVTDENERPRFGSYSGTFATPLETMATAATPNGVESDYLGAMIIATDEDSPADTLTYSIIGCTPTPLCTGAFKLRQDTEGPIEDLNDAQVQRLMIADSSKLDYENTNPSVATNSFTVTVQVSDGQSPEGVDSVTLAIAVQDDNEAPILNDQNKITWNFDECGTNADQTLEECNVNLFIGSCDTCEDPDKNLPDASACASCSSIKSSTVDYDFYNGAPDTFTFELIGRSSTDEEETRDPTFKIDLDTGVMSLSDGYILNHEGKSQYLYFIRVTDKRGKISTTPVEINIADKAEPPKILTLSDTSIWEGINAGTYIANTQTYDADNYDNDDAPAITITCKDDDGNLPNSGAVTLIKGGDTFELVEVTNPSSNSEQTYKIKTKGVLDFEATASYEVILRCTDATGSSADETWTIGVDDVNDTPTWPAQTNCAISRKTGGGVSICSLIGENVAANDGDPFEKVVDGNYWGKLTYEFVTGPTVVSGECNEALASDLFVIEGQETKTPRIEFKADHSELPSTCGNAVVEFTMRACDQHDYFGPTGLTPNYWGHISGTDSCTDTPAGANPQTVRITITPVNDPPSCGSVSGAVYPVDENKGANFVITALAGVGKITDSDSGIASIEIQGTSVTDYFAIVEASGSYNLVTTENSLDYEALKISPDHDEPEFDITVKVTDTDSSLALDETCTFSVRVEDVNEATTFSPQIIVVSESATNTDALPSLVVSDPDEDDRTTPDGNGIFSFNDASEAASSPFSISQSGQLSLKESLSLDYETTPSYTYSVKWSSSSFSTTTEATTTLTIQIQDQSEKPVIAADQVFTMNEGHVGFVGDIVVTDPDFVDTIGAESCGSRCGLLYEISSDPSGIFVIDPATGALSTKSAEQGGGASNFEATASFQVTINVCDSNCDPNAPQGRQNHTLPVTVSLVNVDDCTVSNIYDSTYAGSSDATAIFATLGNEDIYIVGDNLFPTEDRVAGDSGLSDSDITVTANLHSSVDSTSDETLTACAVERMADKPGLDIIKCKTAPGAGGPFAAKVSVTVPYSSGAVMCTTSIETNGAGGLLGATKTYKAPVITQVGCLGSADTCTDLPTSGATVVTITGTDFGPNGSDGDSAAPVQAKYGSYTAECTHTTALHDQVECITPEGVGAGYTWSIVVGTQSSEAFTGITTSYAAPEVTTVYVRKDGQWTSEGLSTGGGDRIEIAGTNFGGAKPGECSEGSTSAKCPTVEYGTKAQFDTGTQFVATGCYPLMTDNNDGHTMWVCSSVPGSGIDLHARFTVGGQSSTPEWTCVRSDSIACDSWFYMKPTITSVTGPGTYRASSMGGQVVYIQGTQFGPKLGGLNPSYDITVSYGPSSNPSAYTAEDCVISTSHSLLTCVTGPGTGKDHSWTVDIGGSVSEAAFTPCVASQVEGSCLGTNYAPPIVAYYEGLGTKYDVDASLPSNKDIVYGDTRGNQTISILGRNFGTDISKVELVSYTKDTEGAIVFKVHDTSSDVINESCVISVAHQTLTCYTAEGAGDEMKWSVRVDGQDSEEPTTGYQGPVISSIQGTSPVDVNALSNYGNELVTITGDFFGPSTTDSELLGYSDDFIDWVKYGPNLHDYTAKDCTVISHTTIECYTVQGVGAESKWSVMINGQESIFADGIVPVSSYAPPVVNDMSPSEYVTDGNILVTITGTNLGTFTKPGITFGGIKLEDTEIILGGVQDTLYFTLPPGIGRQLAVELDVGGQMSTPIKYFDYSYPVISSVSSVDLIPPDDSRVKVVILGSSFSANPVVKMRIAGVESDTTLECDVVGHSEINCYTSAYEGYIRVEWPDGVTQSNEYEFKRGNPVILFNALLDGESGATGGGGKIEVLCQYCGTDVTQLEAFVYNHARGIYVDDSADPKVENDPSTRCMIDADSLTEEMNPPQNPPPNYEPSATWVEYLNKVANIPNPAEGEPGHVVINANEKIQRFICALPQGQDLLQSVVVRKVGTTKISMMCRTEFCSECTFGPCFGYDAPTLTNVEEAPLSDVTGGGKSFTLTGTNFGLDMVVKYGDYNLDVTEKSHTRLVGSIGEGVGAGKTFVVNVGSQSTTSTGFVFNYDIPLFDDVSSLSGIGTRGTTPTGVAAITLAGQNFGDSDIPDYAATGPLLTIGGEAIPIINYDHTSLTFDIPAGQGKNLPFVVNVQGQVNSAEYFTYLPPVISSTSSTSGGSLNLESDTKGGRESNEKITLVGSNFGVIDKSWSLVLVGNTVDGVKETDISVTASEITDGGEYGHEKIVFYVPEGQGTEKALVLTVGNQVATNSGGAVTCGFDADGNARQAAACFSYKPPVLFYWNTTEGQMHNTNGGYEITLTGTSFGTSGAEVTFYDPLYDPSDAVNSGRMPNKCDDSYCNKCIVVSQDHEKIICKVPRGWGSDLHMTVSVDGKMSTTQDRVVDGVDVPGHGQTFSYAKPVIEFIIGSESGDASGAEELRVYGENFGPFKTNVNLKIANVSCENAFWTNDDPLFDNEPYIKCVSSSETTVGAKNVTLEVAFSESDVFDRWEVECKRGFYGKTDEFCAECGDPLLTGYVCERDGLANPYSHEGWWNILQEVGTPGASRCHEEMTTGTRAFCPTMWPCMPGEACLGNNTCQEKYDPTSERCSDCNIGYFKLNGQCAECPDKPWVIALGIIIVGGTAAYIGSKLDKNQVNLGIITIGVDYFQVIAIFSSANVDWPQELTDLWNMLSAFNLNIDLAAPECWQGADFTYDQKWMVVEFTPVALMFMSFVAYVAKYCFKRFKGRKARLHSHAPKLFGTTVTIFYYTYLYVTTKTLSVFNCQPTDPSDGFQYMTEVGTGDGICYEPGSMQQRLEPWAYVTFALYTLGFPAFCGTLLYFNRMTCFLDQVMKAARKSDEELKACGTYKFRKMWHRLYHYYKPQYFYWILLVLFRKFMIAVTSLVFRSNTLFMLSMTLLVIIVSYAIQVKYSPYMSTAEYQEIVDKNSAMIDEVTSMKLMQLKMMQSQNQRSKAAKLGRESLINMGPKMELSFLHNYNTVESSLLFSAIIVNLSGIMFESGQLEGVYKSGLTYFIIILVVASLFYFVWVLATELWTAFYPDKPFLGMPCLNLGHEVKDDDGIPRDSSLIFDTNPLANNPGNGLSDADGKKLDYLEKELNKMWGNVAQKDKLIKAQQDEIRQLKKGGGASKFQGLAKNVIAMNKEKKKFGKVDKRPSTRIGLGKQGSTRNPMGGCGRGLGGSGRAIGMSSSALGGSSKDLGGANSDTNGDSTGGAAEVQDQTISDGQL